MNYGDGAIGEFDEWRVTGSPGEATPSYSFVWSLLRNPHLGDPEAAARAFMALDNVSRWVEGPYLSKRTVTITEWERA